jgi:hypothetical protein
MLFISGAGLALHGSKPEPAHGAVQTIQMSFTNRANATVHFHLNGGNGFHASLRPGQTSKYSMVVNHGLRPTVAISQTAGLPLAFSVSDGGVYEFRQEGNKIKNFFANKP